MDELSRPFLSSTLALKVKMAFKCLPVPVLEDEGIRSVLWDKSQCGLQPGDLFYRAIVTPKLPLAAACVPKVSGNETRIAKIKTNLIVLKDNCK
jgi:hypothetical protein